jgi:quinol-cytochrome oxidoreductase complex cytochrome b subunit/coenzyme F420-reducing hydrogenase delta subunit
MRSVLAHIFLWLEAALDRIFGARWNPLYQLGALGFFYYWVVAVTGIYVYIFFDTGATEAYDSIEYLTHEQWYVGGIMRSLHRYGSDGMALMMIVHMLREFAFDRLKGPRAFTWITGIPVAAFVVISGITGYWLIWDRLAQYIAVATTEWLDWLGIFGVPIARNFLTPQSLDDRFFTLLMFIHIVLPLLLLLVLWIHLQRITQPMIHPNRWLAAGTFAMLVVLSLVQPALSQAPADLSSVPSDLQMDWFYLAVYPLMDIFSNGWVWALVTCLTIVLVVLPWLPPRWKERPAEVHLESCNGCQRCEQDCPYNAIQMHPRSDGLAFDREAVVNPALCVSCGICAGSCPTSTPFRRKSALRPGIELPAHTMADLRDQIDGAQLPTTGSRIMVLGCRHGAVIEPGWDSHVAIQTQPCVASFPPSFIDYILSRNLADGVVITGCGDGGCFERYGNDWAQARIDGRRDPHLRSRVPREKIRIIWASPTDSNKLKRAIKDFAESLSAGGHHE